MNIEAADPPSSEVGGTSRWSKWTRPLIAETVSASLCIGEHGPDYSPDPDRRTRHQAILECGEELLFPVSPTPGELLWCSRHRLWEFCDRVIGAYVVGCHDCQHYEDNFGQDSSRSYRRASIHALGSRGQRNPKHKSRIGRMTRTGIEWRDYNQKEK